MVRLGVVGNLMSLGAIDFGPLVDGSIVMLEAAIVALSALPKDAREVRCRWPSPSMGQSARAGSVCRRHHPDGLSAADGAGGRRRTHVQTDGDDRGAGALRALLFTLFVFPPCRLRPKAGRRGAWGRDSMRAGGRSRSGVWGRPQSLYLRSLNRVLAQGDAGVTALLFVLTGASIGWALSSCRDLDEGELSLISSARRPSRSARRRGWVAGGRRARAVSEVKSIVTRTGRAEVATDPVGPTRPR